RQELVFLVRREKTIGEAAGVESGPEAIAGPAEMMSDRCGVEAGIDAAEQHAQTGADHVGKRALASGFEVSFRGTLLLHDSIPFQGPERIGIIVAPRGAIR